MSNFKIMEKPLLREQEIIPTEEVLKNVLGESYSAFETLINTITTSEFGLIPEWNYYKDGKSWLCKVCHKKKTVFWLSAWDKFFKITFFFTEKHLEGIASLDIEENIKDDFGKVKPVGRLLPLLISINKTEQLSDALKIIEFKKRLK